MPKRRRTQENHSGLDSNTFLCKDQGLLIILIFPGEQRCFYGAARIQCLAGELFVDGFAVPTGGVDLDKMHLMCAPYRFGRPVGYVILQYGEP